MKLKLLSIVSIFVGFVLIVNSSVRNITGNVINQNLSAGISLLGLGFIIGGIVLFIISQKN